MLALYSTFKSKSQYLLPLFSLISQQVYSFYYHIILGRDHVSSQFILIILVLILFLNNSKKLLYIKIK